MKIKRTLYGVSIVLVLAGLIVWQRAAAADDSLAGKYTYYSKMNYVEIDGMKFRLGDNFTNLSRRYENLKTDSQVEILPSYQTSHGLENVARYCITSASKQDKAEVLMGWVVVTNWSGKELSSLDTPVNEYTYQFPDRRVEHEITFPPVVDSIVRQSREELKESSDWTAFHLEVYEDENTDIHVSASREDYIPPKFSPFETNRDEKESPGYVAVEISLLEHVNQEPGGRWIVNWDVLFDSEMKHIYSIILEG